MGIKTGSKYPSFPPLFLQLASEGRAHTGLMPLLAGARHAN